MDLPAKRASFFPVLISVALCGAAGYLGGRVAWSDGPHVQGLGPGAAGTDTVGAENPSGLVPEKAPPSLEALQAALKEPDVFRGAPTALAWVETASLDDLRAFLKNPNRFPRRASRNNGGSFEADFEDAMLDAAVDRWLTAAPHELKTLDLRDSYLGLAVARTKPELVLAEFLSTQPRGPFAWLGRPAFASLAARDLPTARALLGKVAEPAEHRACEYALLRGLAEQDVFAALALLPPSPNPDPRPGGDDSGRNLTVAALVAAAERAGPGVVRRLFAEGKLDEYRDLSQLLLRYPDLAADLDTRQPGAMLRIGMDTDVQREAARMPAAERAKILANYEQLPTTSRDLLAASLVSAWARTEPAEATAWALAHAKPEELKAPCNSAAGYAFGRWVEADPAAAFAWWQKQPPSPLRDWLGTESSTRFATEGDFATALQMFRPVLGRRADAAGHFAELYAAREPAAAAAWAAGLPADYANQTAKIVTGRYFVRDPEATAQWIGGLPPGTFRERAAEQFVKKAGQFDPAGALEWVRQFPDAQFRAETTRKLAKAWQAERPDAARAWVEREPGLDENWRADFLKK